MGTLTALLPQGAQRKAFADRVIDQVIATSRAFHALPCPSIPFSEACADRVIDQCAHMQNLRSEILPKKVRGRSRLLHALLQPSVPPPLTVPARPSLTFSALPCQS